MFRFWLLFLTSVTLLGENMSAQCLCAKSPYADDLSPVTQFKLSDGRYLELCGVRNLDPERFEAVYSGFVLSTCNGDSILAHWDASEDCVAEMHNDTLYVKTMEPLALGDDYELVPTPWLIERFWYKGNKLKHTERLNPDLRYSTAQVNATLSKFAKTKWKQPGTYTEEYSRKMMKLANRLLVAALSGSTLAEDDFRLFTKKYMLEGPYVEWYGNMQYILDYYKENR